MPIEKHDISLLYSGNPHWKPKKISIVNNNMNGDPQIMHRIRYYANYANYA